MPAITIPLADGSTREIPAARVVEWQEKYPRLDVEAELRGLAAWFEGPGKARRWQASQWFFRLAGWMARKGTAARAA